jgi:GntR family transcriptional repressor for pyruvate dehydrogenase complex
MSLKTVARPPTLVEKVYEQLAGTVRGALNRGNGWLPTETKISSTLGVSRSVVREAIKRLETQGLVEIQHGVGIRAVDRLHRPLNGSLELLIPDMAERLRSLIETRLSIEPDAAAYAAQRASSQQIKELKSIHQRLEEAPDNQQAVLADSAFHRVIAEASGNMITRLLLDSLSDLSYASRLRTIGRAGKGRACEQHAAILTAIEARDAESARLMMRVHVLAAREDLDLSALHKQAGRNR